MYIKKYASWTSEDIAFKTSADGMTYNTNNNCKLKISILIKMWCYNTPINLFFEIDMKISKPFEVASLIIDTSSTNFGYLIYHFDEYLEMEL